MKLHKRKIIASVIAFAVIVALVISLSILGKIGVSDKLTYSETFEGSISESAYEDKESAARAFVKNELSGTSAEAEYVGYKNCGSLSKKELSDINVQKLVDDKIEDGEKVEIEYKSSSVKNRVKAYLLESGKNCRYYVLPPEINGAVTNAYLNTVLDGKKYLNCTSTTTVSMSVQDIMTTYNQIIKFDNDKAYFKQGIPGLISDAYLQENGEGITAYIKHPEKRDDKFYSWSEIEDYYSARGYIYELYLTKGEEKVSIDSLTSMQDVTDFCFMLDIDASFFVKTANGFSMPDDKYKAVCKMLAGASLGDEFDKVWNDHKVHFRADYYVTEGRLSKSEVVLRLLFDDKFITASVISDYSDFGSTKVVMPNG